MAATENSEFPTTEKSSTALTRYLRAIETAALVRYVHALEAAAPSSFRATAQGGDT